MTCFNCCDSFLQEGSSCSGSESLCEYLHTTNRFFATEGGLYSVSFSVVRFPSASSHRPSALTFSTPSRFNSTPLLGQEEERFLGPTALGANSSYETG